MTQFVQQIVDGLATGSIYGTMALALVLIYRSTGVINFAQGEMAMFSTYVAWQLTAWNFPVMVAVLLAMALSFVGGVVIERVVLRPVERAELLTIVIVTLGLFLIFNALAGWIWTYFIKSFPSVFPDDVWVVGDVTLSIRSIATFGVIAGQMFALYALFQWTKVGLAMRAAALNPSSSELVGIHVSRMLMVGWGMAAALGALSGALVAPKLFLEPNMMFSVLLYAFAAAALGGLESPLGAVVGGLVVGVTENLAGTYVDWVGSDLKLLVAFTLIIAVLLVRPQGLFGKRSVVRV